MINENIMEKCQFIVIKKLIFSCGCMQKYLILLMRERSIQHLMFNIYVLLYEEGLCVCETVRDFYCKSLVIGGFHALLIKIQVLRFVAMR